MSILSSFEQYMDQFRVNDSKLSITHTSMGNIYKKKGSFHISDENIPVFMEQYKKIVYDHNIPLSMIERNFPEKGMLKFDFDFKYESESLERPYNQEIIISIVSIIQKLLLEYVENQPKNDIYHAYIFLRNKPYKKEKFVKDGIHIMYPNLCLKHTFQFYLRTRLIEELEKIKICNYIPFTNNLSDVVDESIIKRNGWLMYGSTKEGIPPYKLTVILDENCNIVQTSKSEKELVSYLSIRKHIPEAKILKEFSIEENEKKKRKLNFNMNMSSENVIYENNNSNTQSVSITDNLEAQPKQAHENENYIEKLVGLLDAKRCMDYNSWLEVGFCLHNLSAKFFDLWMCFSTQRFDKIIERINFQYTQEEQKYQEYKTDYSNVQLYEKELDDWQEILHLKKNLKETQDLIYDKYIVNPEVFYKKCRDKWDSFVQKSDGLCMGSLIFWVKKDNEKMFKKIKFQCLRAEIEKCVFNPSHAKMAKLLHYKYKDLYKCSDYENNTWYVWEKHYWKRMDGVSTIRRKITGATNDNDSILSDFLAVKKMVEDEKVENDHEYMEIKAEYEKLEYNLEPKKGEQTDFKRKFGHTAYVPDNQNCVKNLSNQLREKKSEKEKKRNILWKIFVKPYEDTIKKFLETTGMIDNIVKEAKQEFYDCDFTRKLNTNPYLFLFGNGVFDLENMNFRDGRPNDYISLETDVRPVFYIDFDLNDDPIIHDIEKYFEKVLVDKNKRQYFLVLIASCLEAYNTNSIFPILTGSGCNSKSLTMTFIEDCFGPKYSGKFNPAFITQKRSSSSSASPEYYGIADCRIVSAEESDNADVLNMAIIKEITGNSKISARTLYQSKMTTKVPQFTAFLICNELPVVKSMDGGTWRRIVVILFDSKFVDDPSDPIWAHLSNVFKIDRSLNKKMESWKEAFMYLLIHKYYKIYVENKRNLIAPECVKAFTDKFKDENDYLQPFIETNIVVTGNKSDTIKIKELYNKIVVWFKEYHQGEKEPTQQSIKKYFESKFGPYDTKGWVGRKLCEF